MSIAHSHFSAVAKAAGNISKIAVAAATLAAPVVTSATIENPLMAFMAGGLASYAGSWCFVATLHSQDMSGFRENFKNGFMHALFAGSAMMLSGGVTLLRPAFGG